MGHGTRFAGVLDVQKGVQTALLLKTSNGKAEHPNPGSIRMLPNITFTKT